MPCSSRARMRLASEYRAGGWVKCWSLFSLDRVEEGEANWKALLADFYKDFDAELKKAEQDLDGERIKVPDEVSEEICG